MQSAQAPECSDVTRQDITDACSFVRNYCASGATHAGPGSIVLLSVSLLMLIMLLTSDSCSLRRREFAQLPAAVLLPCRASGVARTGHRAGTPPTRRFSVESSVFLQYTADFAAIAERGIDQAEACMISAMQHR